MEREPARAQRDVGGGDPVEAAQVPTRFVDEGIEIAPGSLVSRNSSQDSAPCRNRLRRLSCITARNSSARAGSIRYSIVVITGPASGSTGNAVTGAFQLCEGVSSSSAPPSTLYPRVSQSTATPVTAATARLVRTSVSAATCPHNAAPAPAPPISATWNVGRPRARTQFGSASCAAIEIELATVSQAMPATTITGTAT